MRLRAKANARMLGHDPCTRRGYKRDRGVAGMSESRGARGRDTSGI